MTSEEYFKGKRVAVFSLPGAFTPTCSSTHLPGYQQAYGEMKELGIDAVYCLSVNDAFVMRKWGLDQGLVENKEKKYSPDYWKDVQLCVQHRSIYKPTHTHPPTHTHTPTRQPTRTTSTYAAPCTPSVMTLLLSVAAPSRRSIPDGACQFTRGVGMSCTWEKERGFGERSWRGMVRRMPTPPPLRAALERHSSPCWLWAARHAQGEIPSHSAGTPTQGLEPGVLRVPSPLFERPPGGATRPSSMT